MTKKSLFSILSLTATLLFVASSAEFDSDDNTESAVQASVLHSTYRVQQGDNLWRIVFNHGADLDEVAELNGIEDVTRIMPNDEIIIPTSKQTESGEDTAEVEVVEEPKSVAKTSSVSDSKYGKGLEDWQLNILYAVVQQEAVGLTSESQLRPDAYESMLAVMSSMTNRVDGSDWYGTNIYEVMTKRNQYEAYGADHYKPHLGNITETTKRAVHDGLKGVKNHNFLNFRSDWYAEQYGYTGVNIGGNVYFND